MNTLIHGVNMMKHYHQIKTFQQAKKIKEQQM